VRAWAGVVALLVGCGRIGFDDRWDANVIFVTSTAHYPEQLQGLAGADAVCAERAAAGGLTGTFVAWLSTSTVDARDRLGSARGWVRTDNLPFADTREDLLGARIFYPPALDERGRIVKGWPPVATGTTRGGTYDPVVGACGDWTSAAGDTWYGERLASSKGFTEYSLNMCGEAMHLYCMGIDLQVAVTPVARSGRRAFLASRWTPTTGLAGADAHCQALAVGAGLPGTFKALLAGSTASAASRFNLQRATWVRTDGIALAETAVNFMSGKRLSGLAVAADGSPVATDHFVWTGANASGSFEPDRAPSSLSCGDWADGAASGGTGVAGDSGVSMFDASYVLTCEGSYRIYCLED
jgi:hypothetical protein